MTRLADDFAEIRERVEELRREREAVQRSNEVVDAPAPDPEKAAAHAEAIFSDLPISMILDLFGILPGVAYRCSGIELVRGPDGSWSGTVDGHAIDPHPSLATALDVARSLRAPACR